MISPLGESIGRERAVVGCGCGLDRRRQLRWLGEANFVVGGRQSRIVCGIEIDETAKTIGLLRAQHAQDLAGAGVSDQYRLVHRQLVEHFQNIVCRSLNGITGRRLVGCTDPSTCDAVHAEVIGKLGERKSSYRCAVR